MKSNIGQSDVREPFSDFADSADDFRQALERPNRASKALSERLAFPKGHHGQNDISCAVGFDGRLHNRNRPLRALYESAKARSADRSQRAFRPTCLLSRKQQVSHFSYHLEHVANLVSYSAHGRPRINSFCKSVSLPDLKNASVQSRSRPFGDSDLLHSTLQFF